MSNKLHSSLIGTAILLNFATIADAQAYLASMSGTAAPAGAETTPPANTPPVDPKPINAAPSAIKLAEDEGIELADVTGTGKDGKILKSDVQKVVDAPATNTPANDGGFFDDDEDVVPPEVVTVNDVRPHLVAFSEKHGGDKVRAVLKRFGAAKVPEVAETDLLALRDAFVNEL